MPMNDAVNASHGEFIDASEELEALRNVYVLTGMVLERDIRTIAKGAHKLRKAAALLDVFAHSLETVRAERDDAQLELTRMTDAYDLKMRVHDALNRDYVALRKRAAAAEADLNALRKKSGWKCYACYYDSHYSRDVCTGCGHNNDNNWKWRGPCAENGGVE